MNSSQASQDRSITVEYALTRGEILRSYLRSIIRSPALRNRVLFYGILIGSLELILQTIRSRSLTLAGAMIAIATVVCYLLLVSLGVFLRGKTAKRTLTISRDGIYTEIGRIKANVSWNQVRSVAGTPNFVLIVRTNGNSFFVPDRAFSGAVDRALFLSEIESWRRVKNS